MWWQSFYDQMYLELWGGFYDEAASAAQADALIAMLGLAPGARVLDAPCGFGRLSRPLAARGMKVTGVDRSQALLDDARARGGDITYVLHDLRAPLAQQGFDAALNIFSSIGHDDDAGDRAVFATFAHALAPGGRAVVETMHRDVLVARRASGALNNRRTYPDGTVMIEEAKWDPVHGTVESTWRWSGPRGDGEKRSRLRLYAIPELIALVEGAGLHYAAAYQGCSTTPFTGDGPTAGGRVALVFTRPQ
ncbi:MAG TPA: class I SAM-dependent methyltransferase [Kofleriaceae bacterium]|jgi:SAM-dependent methyltransferase|nr:class I SAM-dependent methyltransferase [Kofleriaceae bacterium]